MPSDLNRPPGSGPIRPPESNLNRPPEDGLDRPPESNRSVPDLFNTAIGQVSTLFRKEIQLAQAEMSEKFGQAAGAIAPLAGGAGLLLASLVVLLFSAVSLLTWLGLAAGWSRLIVAVVFALIGYGLVRMGMSQLKVSNLMPERTAEQLSRDAETAKEQVR